MSIGQSALGGMKWFFIVNLFQKVTTFTLNQFLIRWTSPEIFGLAAVQFELLLSTLLFLSREGIRMATLREVVDSDEKFRRLVNISWFPSTLLFVVLLVSCGLVLAGFQFGSYDSIAVILYCGGALCEALGEPIFNYFQNNIVIGPQLKAESIAVLARSIVTVGCVGWLKLGVRGFGIAQLVYGLVHFVILATSMKLHPINGQVRRFSEFLPHIGNDFVDKSMLSIAFVTTGTSLLKHLLTEADKIILSIFSSSYDQGIFAVANNYGSLVARMIFLPIENSSRLAFAKLSTDVVTDIIHVEEIWNSSSSTQHDERTRSKIVSMKSRIRNKLAYMSQLLFRLLASVVAFAIIFPLFGLPYVKLLVHIVFSAKWQSQETVDTLTSFCFYLLVLGVNGLIEAFVQSVAPPNAFLRLNIGLILSTVVYVGSAVPLISKLGTSGVVIANILSMSVRIISNAMFLHGYFRKPFDCLSNETGIFAHIDKTDFGTHSPLSHLNASINGGMLSTKSIVGISLLIACQALMWRSSLNLNSEIAFSDSHTSFPWSKALMHVVIGAACFCVCVCYFIYSVSLPEIKRTLRVLRGQEESKLE